MDLSGFEAAVKTGKLEKGLYLLAGREDFLKERLLERVARALVPVEDHSENVVRLDFGKQGFGELNDRLGSFSFNPSRRLFFLFFPEELSATERKKLLEILGPGKIPPDSLVVLVTRENAVCLELQRGFGERGERIDVWPPFENQLPSWVRKEASELGVSMASDAAEKLIERLGGDLRLLSQELEKLCLCSNGKESGRATLTRADVEKTVRYQRQDSVFDWLEAIGSRNLGRALRIQEGLAGRGEPIQRLWFMLVRFLRDLRLFRDLHVDRPDLTRPLLQTLSSINGLQGKSDFRSNQDRKGLTEQLRETAKEWPGPLADSLGLYQPMQWKNLGYALNFERAELLATWPKLLEIDERLKSSPPNPGLLVQNLLMELLVKQSSRGNPGKSKTPSGGRGS